MAGKLETFGDADDFTALRWHRIGAHRVRLGQSVAGQRIVAVEHPAGERGTCHLLAGIDLYGKFTERDVRRVLDVDAPPGAPDTVWKVGRLVSLHVDDGGHCLGHGRPHHRRCTGHELRPRPWLASDGDERLWICEGDRWKGFDGAAPLLAVEYMSDKWDRRMRPYIHDFEDPLPTLRRGPRGHLLIEGGAYRLTNDGIEG